MKPDDPRLPELRERMPSQWKDCPTCGEVVYIAYFKDGEPECVMCAMKTRRRERGGCTIQIFHGPGHQSKTFCRLDYGHDGKHEAVYGSWNQWASWEGGDVFSGAFDEAP